MQDSLAAVVAIWRALRPPIGTLRVGGDDAMRLLVPGLPRQTRGAELWCVARGPSGALGITDGWSTAESHRAAIRALEGAGFHVGPFGTRTRAVRFDERPVVVDILQDPADAPFVGCSLRLFGPPATVVHEGEALEVVGPEDMACQKLALGGDLDLLDLGWLHGWARLDVGRVVRCVVDGGPLAEARATVAFAETALSSGQLDDVCMQVTHGPWAESHRSALRSLVSALRAEGL